MGTNLKNNIKLAKKNQDRRLYHIHYYMFYNLSYSKLSEKKLKNVNMPKNKF